MKKTTIFKFCFDFIKNDADLKSLTVDPILLMTVVFIATDCIIAYQEALLEGVEFETSKKTED